MIVYHFMLGPDWTEGCVGCSFVADSFSNVVSHIEQRNVRMVAISRAPLEKINQFKARMGWTFKWLSSFESDFNYDFHVSFTPEQVASGDIYYNYAKPGRAREEGHGISVFYKDVDGRIYHTYSCFARGVDAMMTAYQYLDLLPEGRNEDPGRPSSWIRHHDRYGSTSHPV